MGVLTKHMYVAPTPPSQLLGGAQGARRARERHPALPGEEAAEPLRDDDGPARRARSHRSAWATRASSRCGPSAFASDTVSGTCWRTSSKRRAPRSCSGRAAAGHGSSPLRAPCCGRRSAPGARSSLALAVWWVGRSIGARAAIRRRAGGPRAARFRQPRRRSRRRAGSGAGAAVRRPLRRQVRFRTEAPARGLPAPPHGLRRSHRRPLTGAGSGVSPAQRPKKPKRPAVGAGEIVDPWAE